MIQISRDLVGRMHRGFKKAAKKDGRYSPTVVFQADGTGLVVHSHSSVTVEYRLFGDFPECRFGLSLSVLNDFAGRDISPVTLAQVEEEIVATWNDAGIPQRRSYPALAADKLPVVEALPETHRVGEKTFLATFAEACRSAATDRSRFALDCLCLRGKTDEIVATNGRQLLVIGGIEFPWTDDVLVPASDVFGSREFPADRPVEIARTDSHVAVHVGSWTIWLKIEKEARFPHFDDIIPNGNSASTRLRLSENDRQFLARTLPKLSVPDDFNCPVTIDCNGHVAIRSLSPDGYCTELTLSASHYTGDQVRVTTNRDLLLRAVELGFTELLLHGDKRPIVGQGGGRRFVWQPLSSSPVEARSDATRIVSDARDTPVAVTPPAITEIPAKSVTPIRHIVPERHVETGATRTDSVRELIEHAEEVKRTLREAAGRLTELISRLRGHRRQSRAVKHTIASLRHLEQVAG